MNNPKYKNRVGFARMNPYIYESEIKEKFNVTSIPQINFFSGKKLVKILNENDDTSENNLYLIMKR